MTTQTAAVRNIRFRDKDSNEPTWLFEQRKQAWDFYHNAAMPERIEHLWRYSDPDHYALVDPENYLVKHRLYPDIFKAKELNEKQGIDAYWANNSDMKAVLQSSEAFRQTGAHFEELSLVINDDKNSIDSYIGQLIPAKFGKFEALNMALWNNGIFVYIPDNTVIEKPIYLYRHPNGAATFSRLLVVLGKNAQATIIDDYKCPCNKEQTLFNSIVEIFAGDSSRLSYVNLQRLALDNRAFITQRTKLGHDAESYTLFASLGSGLSKIDAGTILAGRGATSNMFGIAFGDKNQQFDHHTVHHHKASDSYSNIDFKTVMKEKSASAYTGLIKIEQDAQNCEAYQENRNLLLSEKARAETIPELEILTDQVRCSHGATVGPLDEEMVFYLTSRGISRQEAIKTIVSGFVEPTLGKMPDSLGDTIRDIVYDKLEGR